MPIKKTPQTQLQIQPNSKRAMVISCRRPMEKLTQQLPTREPVDISSFRAQQNVLNPAMIVPVETNEAANGMFTQ